MVLQLGLSEVLTNPRLKNWHSHETYTRVSGLVRPKQWQRDMRSGTLRWIFRELGCGGMDWIDLAQVRDRWLALVNAAMNLRVP